MVLEGEKTSTNQPLSTSFCEGDCSAKLSASEGDKLDTKSASKGGSAVQGETKKEKEKRSICDNGITQACQPASVERTTISSALFFVFEFTSASAGQATFKSLLADKIHCNRVTAKGQSTGLDHDDKNTQALDSITYYHCRSSHILDSENGFESVDASTAAPAISPSAARAVITMIRIITISVSKGTTTKDALELIITYDVNFMLFVLVSVFCVVWRSSHQSPRTFDCQRTDLPFQRSILRHKDFIFHVSRSFVCTMLVQFAIFGHKSKRVLMKDPTSILLEGVQIKLNSQFKQHFIATQILNKHFGTRISASTIFRLQVIGILEFYGFRRSVTKQKTIIILYFMFLGFL